MRQIEAWQAEKPVTGIEPLGIVRIREILNGEHKAELDDLIAQDKAVEIEVKAIRSVEKLLRYNRDLFRLVNNFVSFRDFYTGKNKAIFQVGTLYLDGRSCELCVRGRGCGQTCRIRQYEWYVSSVLRLCTQRRH